MPFAQIKDLLKRTSAYHKRLEELYRGIEQATHKDAVRYLADYMKGREKVLQRELARFSAEKLHGVNEEFLQADPQFNLEEVLEGLPPDPDGPVEELVASGVRANQKLVEYYRRLGASAPTQELKEFFAQLEKFELEEQKNLANLTRMY